VNLIKLHDTWQMVRNRMLQPHHNTRSLRSSAALRSIMLPTLTETRKHALKVSTPTVEFSFKCSAAVWQCCWI